MEVVQKLEQENAIILSLITEGETAVVQVHHQKQWSVMERYIVLYQDVTPLGLSFQNVLPHVGVWVHVIELEIVLTLNLSMAVKIVFILVQQWRRKIVTPVLVLSMGGTPHGQVFQIVLSCVEVAVISELEVVTIQNLNMVVKTVQL